MSLSTPPRSALRRKTPTPTRACTVAFMAGSPAIELQPPPKFDPRGETTGKVPSQHPVHIDLGFTLYVDGIQHNPTEDELEKIAAVFPTCYSVTIMNPLLILHYRTLPPLPWPLTIAGLPVYLTTDEEEFPLELGLPAGGTPLELASDIRLWKTPTMEVMRDIFEGFDRRGIRTKGIQWMGVRFLAEIEGEPPNNWRSDFPRRINQVHVSYVFGENVETPGSLRLKPPTDADPDDANYSTILRPGIMISSGIGPDGSELCTTSGVCVQSPSGTKYVTCASHGFPLGLEDVYHPNVGGAKVGRVSKQLWDSDISLFRPCHGFQYARETFSLGGYQSKQFALIKHPIEMRVGDLLYMDTPFNGHCEGIVTAIQILRVPSDEPVTMHRYVLGTFAYLGNGSDRPLDGCCGGVVWTGEFEVIGQFRYLSKRGCVAYLPSFQHLIELGYKLSQIEEEN